MVRLYWMGCWRKIIVDDFLPVDVKGNVLLPSLVLPKKPVTKIEITENLDNNETNDNKSKSKGSSGKDSKKGSKKGSKKSSKKGEVTDLEEVELWPYILCKALLKLASLSWTYYEEIVDFDIIFCLTGWVAHKVRVTGNKLLKFIIIVY